MSRIVMSHAVIIWIAQSASAEGVLDIMEIVLRRSESDGARQTARDPRQAGSRRGDLRRRILRGPGPAAAHLITALSLPNIPAESAQMTYQGGAAPTMRLK